MIFGFWHWYTIRIFIQITLLFLYADLVKDNVCCSAIWAMIIGCIWILHRICENHKLLWWSMPTIRYVCCYNNLEVFRGVVKMRRGECAFHLCNSFFCVCFYSEVACLLLWILKTSDERTTAINDEHEKILLRIYYCCPIRFHCSSLLTAILFQDLLQR